MSFLGYRRADGSVGVRNHVAVIPTVACANAVASAIATRVEGAVPILHDQGCSQLLPDLEQITRTLISLGRNPNFAAVLVVSLGCESISADRVIAGIEVSGKPIKRIDIQAMGGSKKALQQGIAAAQELVAVVSKASRVTCSVSDLCIGLKCGASDTTSGLSSNPATGIVTDLTISQGGTVIFGETTEATGAEHVLSRRAATPEIARAIVQLVNDMEARAKSMGVDSRGANPSAGNIRGGLSSIEEKSLGAIAKAGSAPISGVLKYGEMVPTKGLYMVDTPGRELEALPGLAAAGAQIIIFTTGLGATHGFPGVPVIKVTGNVRTATHLADHIDVDVSSILQGQETLSEGGQRIFQQVLAVASGQETKAELLGLIDTINIYTTGPVI